MKIAVVGSGISGLVSSYLLGREHEVTLFEGNAYPGGHTNTVAVEVDGAHYSIDTGFIVYNDWTYPNFIGLLNELDVQTQPTNMGFSVKCDRCGLQYNGSSLTGLFVQKRNLCRPSFLLMIREILRFNREAPALLETLSDDHTVGEYLREHHYSKGFAEHYLLPMGAAIWSCPMSTFEQFPIKFIIEFYKNHGLLQVRNRPTWRVITGGSRCYVEKILNHFSGTLKLNHPIQKIERFDSSVALTHALGTEIFDEVIMACHSDTALKLLASPTTSEIEILRGFPYGNNVAVLHTDESLLPAQQAWASWNYHLRTGIETRPSVTYNMNILQGITSPKQFCVTLNEEDAINPELVLARFYYAHPIFTTNRSTLQARHHELIRQAQTSFCGAYWGNGFHEDGVNSALKVVQAFGIDPKWNSRNILTQAQP